MAESKEIDREAFKLELYRTGSVGKARLAAGYEPAQARKGWKGLPKDLSFLRNAPRESYKPAPVVLPPAVVPALPPSFDAAKIQPGESRNPEGGSFKASLRGEIRRQLKGNPEKIGKIVETMIEDATEAPKPLERLAVSKELIEQLDGRVPQTVFAAGIFYVTSPGEDVLQAAFGSVPPVDDDFMEAN